MANPENKQIPYESTQQDIRDAIESVATAIGGITHPDAEDIVYDNSVSGLSATDVQNALDEIVSDIPTVNNGTLTIQQNGTSKGSFTANSASNVNVNIETPTADKKTATDQFTTADGGLLSKCMINLVPVQSGSGDPSPDNIRPISGHTEVDLLTEGKNLLENVETVTSHSSVSFTKNSDGSVYAKGTVGQNVGYYVFTNETNSLSPNKVTRFKAGQVVRGTTGSGRTLSVRYSDGVYGSIPANTAYTLPKDVACVYVQFNAGTTVDELITPMIWSNVEDTDPTFEPYKGKLYQVQIGSTVYGGYVDLVSGEMTATHGYVDLGSISYTYELAYTRFKGTVSGVKTGVPTRSLPMDCSCYFVVDDGRPLAQVTDGSIYTGGADNTVYIHDSRYTIGTDLATALTGQTLCFPLNTPQTIQLTPQQIETLAGQNNLSTPLSGQSIETNGVEYKELFTFADVKEYVDKKIPDAPTTDGTYTLQVVVSGGVPTYSWI